MTKKVLITGASSGLGLSHAIYLTSKGYKVIGTSRNAENLDLDKLKKKFIRDHTKYKVNSDMSVEEKGVKLPGFISKNLDDLLSKIQFVSLDITDEASVNNALKELDFDILVNNAGNGYYGSIEELSIEDAKDQYDINYFGPIRVIKAVLQKMREKKQGMIINTGSFAGLASVPFQSHYAASKSSVMMMSESLRIELAPFNIKVTTIVPGDINTPFNSTTASLISDSSSITSTNLSSIKQSLENNNSPYKERADIVWNSIVRNLIISPPPLKVSKKLEKVIRSKNPKVHNHVSDPIQGILIWLKRRLFPDRLYLFILQKYFGL